MFDDQNQNNFNGENSTDTNDKNINQEGTEVNTPETGSSDNKEHPNFISFVPPEGSGESTPPTDNVPPSTQPPYTNYQSYSSPSSNPQNQNDSPNQFNQNQQSQSYQSFYNTPQKKQSSSAPLIIGICAVVAVLLIGLVALGVLGSGILTNGIISSPSDSTESSVSNSSVNSTTDNTGVNPGGDVSVNDVPEYSASTGDALTGVEIADKVTPSIVGILNYTQNSESQDFGYYYGNQQSSSEPNYTLSGQGSGILVDVNNSDTEHTYIITNQHVIDGAAYVGVVLYDENGMTTDNHYQAEVVGEDSTTDLALLRIEVTGLTTAELADSDQVKKGETVYAIGNPGGLELACSITQGIVSGVNRNMGSTNFIQTDVAVNPGNSGGALVNQFGQVIGIISQKLLTVSTTDAEGLSFAIPTSVAKPILDDLLNYGYVTGRVTLNITCETVSDMVAYFNRLPNDARVRVTSVVEDSAVAHQGLAINDFIVEFNGTAVLSIDELAAERDKYSAGDTINMKIYRYSTGEYFTITFNLEEDTGS